MLENQVLEMEKIAIVTADHKHLKCYDVAMEIEGKNICAHDIRQTAIQNMQKVGCLLHAQFFLDDKNNFESAVKSAMNTALTPLKCVKFHIGRMEAK